MLENQLELPPAQCVAQMLEQAQRLGVLVRWQPASRAGLEGAYHAQPGQPGLLELRASASAPASSSSGAGAQ